MSNAERKQQIRDYHEAMDTYEILLEEAATRGDGEEVSFLRTQIQNCKRHLVALKTKKEFVPRAEESLYFAMMGT